MHPMSCPNRVGLLAGSLLILLANTPTLSAQGCVAVRCNSLSLGPEGQAEFADGEWQAGVAYRWLHSDRHFRGGREEPHRQAEGSEVINDTHTFDLTATYALTPRFQFSLAVPFVYSDRSSKYEHLGNKPDANPRFTTSAGGLADLRLMANAWLLNPETHPNGNVALALGVKAPTGDYQAEDDFTRPDGAGGTLQVRRPVDQSIQPGDGGWGLLLELQGFQRVYRRLFAYANVSYLMNPRDVNGVPTANSTPASPTIMSVPDAYLLRAGWTVPVWPARGLSLSLGGRLEGVPVRDWGGGSHGFRRPGYAVSIEPGLTWQHAKYFVTLNAPVALERNREKSVSDLATGRHGDAAFADFLILFSVARRF